MCFPTIRNSILYDHTIQANLIWAEVWWFLPRESSPTLSHQLGRTSPPRLGKSSINTYIHQHLTPLQHHWKETVFLEFLIYFSFCKLKKPLNIHNIILEIFSIQKIIQIQKFSLHKTNFIQKWAICLRSQILANFRRLPIRYNSG